MCPTQYQDQLLSNFIESLRSPVVMPTFRCHSIWLGQMAQRSKRSPALVWAIRAISIAQLGKKASDEALTQTSRRVYGKALMKLNEALQDREEGLSSDTLSATVLLSIYEIFNCTGAYPFQSPLLVLSERRLFSPLVDIADTNPAIDGNSWVKHAGGAGHLIRLRGPDRHRTGFGLTVFRACRYSLVMEAFQNRQPCFLDQPEWRSMCWDIYKESAIHGVLPMANEEYFQEFVAFPGFLHDVLAMVEAPDPSTEELQATLRRGQARRQTFQDVYTRMDAEFQRSGMAPVSQQSTFNDTQFPEVYHYLDIHIASMYCGYWSVSCALNVALLGIEAKLTRLYNTGRQSPDREPDEVEEEFIMPNGATIIHRRAPRPFFDAAAKIGSHPYMEENQLHARNVCKSVEFMASTPFLGPLFLVMSLRLVLRIFAGANEKSWVIKQLDMIGDRMGLAKSAVEEYKVQYAGSQAPGFAGVITSLPERTA